MTIDEVQQETAKDSVLSKLSEAIALNNWLDPEVKPFLNVKDELSVCNGLILRNHRLVLPHSLQNKAVDLAHTGHQGIVKTKMLLREKVWFPSIDKLVEEKVKTCLQSRHSCRYLDKSRPSDHDQTLRCTMERSRCQFRWSVPVGRTVTCCHRLI